MCVTFEYSLSSYKLRWKRDTFMILNLRCTCSEDLYTSLIFNIYANVSCSQDYGKHTQTPITPPYKETGRPDLKF